MNRLELWKNVSPLSVDEFMCLLFELEPGTVQFDYGDQKLWPENADLIYRMLSEDLHAKKLCVLFDDISGDPFYNGAYDRFYAGNDNPWWAACSGINSVGKIHRRELVKWLLEKGIPSDFFGTAQPRTVIAKQENSAAQIAQTPVQDTVTEGKPMKADCPLLINFAEVINVDPAKISPQLVANNYLLIGILLEFIVGDFKDLAPKNQSELAEYIVEKYYKDGIKGVSERNVNKKFAIANTLKLMLDKAKNQHDVTLKDALG